MLAIYQASEAYDAHHAAFTSLLPSSLTVSASLAAQSIGSGPEIFNPWSSLAPGIKEERQTFQSERAGKRGGGRISDAGMRSNVSRDTGHTSSIVSCL